MALQGTLDTFALADLVRLLATTSKTGELVIDGDRGTGRLWFADGILVGGEPAGGGGSVDALFALLRFAEGGFAFEADVAAPEDSGPPGDAVALLTEAEERIEAWRPIEAVVPSPAVSLALSAELVDDDVHLDRDQWQLITTIAGGSTAAAVAEALDLDEVGAATRIKDLVDLGAVEVGPAVEEEPTVEAQEAADDPEPTAEAEAEDATDPVDDEAEDLDAPVAESDAEEAVPAFEPVEVVDPLADEVVEPVEALPARPDVAGEPRPSLRALSRPEPDVAPSVNGSSAPEPLLSFEGAIDPPELLPEDLPGEPTPEVEAPAPAAGSGGSTQVDLDATMDTESDGHRYLGSADAEGLPEPLPGDGPEALPEPVEAVVTEADPVEDPTGTADEVDGLEAMDALDALTEDDDDAVRAAWPTGDSDDLAVQLDALSPAAARAVAAAASSGDVSDDDSDAGRKVLRRIISSGRS